MLTSKDDTKTELQDDGPCIDEYDFPTFAAGWQNDHDRHASYSPHAEPGEDYLW